MNQHFQGAVKAVKSLGKAGASLWSSLVMFAMTLQDGDPVQPDVNTDMKGAFKKAELVASIESKVAMAENSTYRAAKSVITNAVAAGILLTDDKGKPRGKTEIEDELKALKEEKTELEKFKSSIATASKIAAKLDAKDIVLAATLANDLFKLLREKLQPELAKAA